MLLNLRAFDDDFADYMYTGCRKIPLFTTGNMYTEEC